MVIKQLIVTEESGSLERVEGKVFGPATAGAHGLLIVSNQRWQVEAVYDDMDEDEQDTAFRALSLSRLQDDLSEEPDYDPEV
jgi:hypothetical protein